MKLTNRLELPDAFVQAVKNDNYSKGDADISVTGLLKPAKASELEREHWDAISEDVSDRVWALFGQVTHLILERANRVGVAERRLSIEVEGWKVSGGMDLYDDGGVLSDYKTTSVWSLIYPDGVAKWEKQMNLYAVILRANGHKVEAMQAVALLRDWSFTKAREDKSYPQASVVNVPIRVWPPAFAEKFLRERVILHKQARLTGQLPDCSELDRWVRDEKWAVKKIGGKMAVRGGVHSTPEAASAFLASLPDKDKHQIEHRPGTSTMCERFCKALPWCEQGKSLVNETPDERPKLSLKKPIGETV